MLYTLRGSMLAAVCAIGWLSPCAPSQEDREPKLQTNPEKIKAALIDLSKGKGDVSKLSLVYDDFHGFHGGLTLTIWGNGKIEQKAMRTKVKELKKSVSPEDLKKLIALLVEHSAWEQRIAQRAAKPDESKAKLTITYGEFTVTIWEWFNDLNDNQRIAKVREQMKNAAWIPGNPK